jgi:hypothetical protein
MRRWKGASRWGTAVLAVCLMAAAAGCGQLFSVSGSGSGSQSTDQQSLAQRVTQLEATVSELQAAVAGLSGGQGSSVAATSSGGGGGAQAMVTASYLNVRQSPDANSMRVGVLKQDTVVSVLAQSGDWSQIHYGPVTGWVESQWLTAPGGGGTSSGTSGARQGAGGAGGSTGSGGTGTGGSSSSGGSSSTGGSSSSGGK